MKIQIENNILDALSFEKNHEQIKNVSQDGLEIITQGSIGFAENFKLEENRLNIAKIVCSVTSDSKGKNMFTLKIERLVEFKYFFEVSEKKDDIQLKNIVEELSKLVLNDIILQAEQILKDSGLGDIKLKNY